MVTLTFTTLILVVSTVLCTSTAQLLQKQAATLLVTKEWYSFARNITFLKSVALLALGMFTWLLVLKNLDVSLAYPLLSINFIVVPLLARWKLGEHLPPQRITGAMVIIVGLIFLLID